ncbi:hypothetical protein Ahia01_001250900 [Argonauta hians]
MLRSRITSHKTVHGQPTIKLPDINHGPIILEQPECPLVEMVPSWLKDRTCFTIIGKAEEHQTGFSINLTDGSSHDPLSDADFHMDIRLQSRTAVFNCYHQGKWGQEDNKYLPLKKNLLFDFILMVSPSEVTVFFNGFLYHSFNMKVSHWQHLIIKGSVQLKYVRIDGATLIPPLSVPALSITYDLKVPYNTEIPGGMHQGKVIVFSGYPTKFNPKRFTVNLNTEFDTAVHFDVRIDQENFKQSVVRNSYIAKHWGEEETYIPYFPFSAGVGFDCMIVAEEHYYRFVINSRNFVTFHHRIKNPDKVKRLQIFGDLHLIMVSFYGSET